MNPHEDAAQPGEANLVEAVELYWRPGCPFCKPLWRSLERAGVPLREVNIWEDPEAAERLRRVTGGSETVPTVFIGERALVGAPAPAVLAALEDLAPHLLANRPEGGGGLRSALRKLGRRG